MELQKGDFGGLGDPMSSGSSRSLTPRTASVRRSGTVGAQNCLYEENCSDEENCVTVLIYVHPAPAHLVGRIPSYAAISMCPCGDAACRYCAR